MVNLTYMYLIRMECVGVFLGEEFGLRDIDDETDDCYYERIGYQLKH